MNTENILQKPEQFLAPLLPEKKADAGSIVPLPKAVVMNTRRSTFIDNRMVAFHYYNAFNYSLLQKADRGIRLAIGISSANAREGKSLVASNLAVSLTLGYKKKTVLVDLNMRYPVLHEVFGTMPGPGLYEALNGGDVNVWQTSIEHLHLLSCGGQHHSSALRNGNVRGNGSRQLKKPRYLGLDQMTAFSDVITSLQQEYEFVVVDMPALNTEDFPILFANRLDGVLMVVDSLVTKRNEMERVFRKLNENQVLGFVLNRVRDDGD